MRSFAFEVRSRPGVAEDPVAAKGEPLHQHTTRDHAVQHQDLRLQAPLGEALQVGDVHQHHLVVEGLHAGLEDAAHPELPRPDVLAPLHQVHGDRVAGGDLQAPRQVARKHQFVRRGTGGDVQHVSLHQVPAQEGPVLVGAHALHHHALDLLARLDDARMRGEHLDVRDAGYAVQGGEEVLPDGHPLRFLGIGLRDGGDLQVGAGAGYLRPDLPLKARTDGHRDDHDRHADDDPQHRDQYDGP